MPDRQSLEPVYRVAKSSLKVVNRAEHHWASKPGGAGHQLRSAEPKHTLNTFIQLALVGLSRATPSEGNPEIRCSTAMPRPKVNPDRGFRDEMAARFFQYFPHNGCPQCLADLHMASWLVDYEPTIDSLFDEQKAAAALDHGRYGQFGERVVCGG